MVRFENNFLQEPGSQEKFQRIGILGGMFNPVHNAHLRVAVECNEAFGFDELRMFPCAEPPHREIPCVSSKQRLEMLQLALENVDGVQADGRELDRSGPSYTVDTLRTLKKEFPHATLYLIVGSDAFQSLDKWHEWETILELSSIVIARRPDSQSDLSSHVGQLLKSCFAGNTQSFLNGGVGRIFSLEVSQLEISSSHIRELISKNKSAQFLLPEVVLNFIKKNRLYK